MEGGRRKGEERLCDAMRKGARSRKRPRTHTHTHTRTHTHTHREVHNWSGCALLRPLSALLQICWVKIQFLGLPLCPFGSCRSAASALELLSIHICSYPLTLGCSATTVNAVIWLLSNQMTALLSIESATK